MRLIGAVLVEIDEVWTTGKRYFDMAEYREWKANTEKRQREVKIRGMAGSDGKLANIG